MGPTVFQYMQMGCMHFRILFESPFSRTQIKYASAFYQTRRPFGPFLPFFFSKEMHQEIVTHKVDRNGRGCSFFVMWSYLLCLQAGSLVCLQTGSLGDQERRDGLLHDEWVWVGRSCYS